jgi:host factor-I protein
MNEQTKKNKPLQETFLNELRKNKTKVSVFMVNGIKLDGHIISFDQFSILLGGKVDQLVYKQKISTIAPADHTRHSSADHSRKHKER